MVLSVDNRDLNESPLSGDWNEDHYHEWLIDEEYVDEDGEVKGLHRGWEVDSEQIGFNEDNDIP